MRTKSPFFHGLNTMFLHMTSLTCCMSFSAISDPSPYMVWKPQLVPPRTLRKKSLRKNIRIERRRYFILPKRLYTRYSSSHAIFQWNTCSACKHNTPCTSQHLHIGRCTYVCMLLPTGTGKELNLRWGNNIQSHPSHRMWWMPLSPSISTTLLLQLIQNF